MKAIHKRYGDIPIRTLPTISVAGYLFYVFVKKMLKREVDWRDYGGKHYESVWTRFSQGYYLPTKFGFDKRKTHLSSLICSGSMTREDALSEMEKPIYDENLLRQDMQFVIKKLGFTQDEFKEIIKMPLRPATDFPSHYFLFHTLQKYKNIFRRIATSA